MTAIVPGDVVAPLLGAQLDAFRQRISEANRPGDLDGLWARHLMGDAAGIVWDVNPLTEAWLADNAERLDDAGPLASVGYALAHPSAGQLDMTAPLRAALGRFMQRDHLRTGGPTFLHDSRTLLGIALVVVAMQTQLPEGPAWLVRTLADTRLKLDDRFRELMRAHVLTIAANRPAEQIRTGALNDPADLALVYWMISQNTARVAAPAERLTLSQRVMYGIMRTDPTELTITQAAPLTTAAHAITNTSIDQVLLSRTHLSLLLKRFPAAMRRWRWDDDDRAREPIRWPITSEREIQDILFLILRSVFDDLKDEDTNPKVGHASTRSDFGIPSLRVLIEVKYIYTGTAAEFKKIEQAVMTDSVAYLQRATHYDEIVVFIYDSTATVEHHDLTRDTLIQVRGIADVIIVSRPGVLAGTDRSMIARPVAKRANKATPKRVAGRRTPT